MTRMLLVLAITSLTIPMAHAKDVCVQVDTGNDSGSLFVLKKVALGKQKVGPVQGYFASFDQSLLFFTEFLPVYGESIVSSGGGFLAGLSLQKAYIAGTGGLVLEPITRHVNLRCSPGTDEKIDVLDACAAYFDAQLAQGHVVDCKESAPPIP